MKFILLHTSTELILRDSLGEVEKKRCIALPGKGGHNKLIPSNCPNLKRVVRSFIKEEGMINLWTFFSWVGGQNGVIVASLEV